MALKVLVACEESQRVCIAFRERGHEAYSCDIQECSGGHPEWHIKGDCLPILNGRCEFETMDGKKHHIDGKWDLIIAHPPCTYLTLAGNKWFKQEYKDRFPNRERERNDAIAFFMKFGNADCDRIAIENPVCIMSSRWRKPDQYIEPFFFGEPEKKKTGLWLKGLPLLKPTNIVEPIIVHCASGANEPRWHMETMKLPKEERSRARSKTFPGIAKAMAEQWSRYIEEGTESMNRLTKSRPITEYEAMNLSLTDLYVRLKSYEDTGLEPEEVEAAKEIAARLALADYQHNFQGERSDIVSYMRWITSVMKEAKAWWKNLFEAREDAEKALEEMKNDK